MKSHFSTIQEVPDKLPKYGYGSIPIDTFYIILLLLGDEHPFATYFDVHQGYMVLTHSHIPKSSLIQRETSTIPLEFHQNSMIPPG
jgi:hypothetical protein